MINKTDGIENDEPGYEPEWCEDCQNQCEECGIEYTADFYHDGDSWYCDHCGGAV